MLIVAPAADASPIKRTPWADVLAHIRDKLYWTDPSLDLALLDAASLSDATLRAMAAQADIVLALGVWCDDGCACVHGPHGPYRDASTRAMLQALPRTSRQSLIGLDCGADFPPFLQGYRPGGPLQALEQRLPWTAASKAAKVRRPSWSKQHASSRDGR